MDRERSININLSRVDFALGLNQLKEDQHQKLELTKLTPRLHKRSRRKK